MLGERRRRGGRRRTAGGRDGDGGGRGAATRRAAVDLREGGRVERRLHLLGARARSLSASRDLEDAEVDDADDGEREPEGAESGEDGVADVLRDEARVGLGVFAPRPPAEQRRAAD